MKLTKKKYILIVLIYTSGFLSGILLKVFSFILPTIFILISLIIIGLVTGGIKYKRFIDLKPEEKNFAIIALIIFIVSMLFSLILSLFL